MKGQAENQAWNRSTVRPIQSYIAADLDDVAIPRHTGQPWGELFQNRGKWHYEKETNNIITIAYKRTVYSFYVIKDRKYQLATDNKH